MRIRAVVSFAGIGFSVQQGEVTDLPDAVAMEAVRQGHAEPAPKAEKTEHKARRTKNESK